MFANLQFMARPTSASERYQRINHLFNLRKGNQAIVTTAELLDLLQISQRQLRMDMQKMREIGAPLEYIARERGWRYTEPFDFSESIPLTVEDLMQLRLATETLARANQIPNFAGLKVVFEKIRQAVRRWVDQEATLHAVYFDPVPQQDYSELLAFFLMAIEEEKQVVFQYQSFSARTAKSCRFDPYFLRQHQQRWYVGGFSHDPAEQFIRTFPLDRIQEPYRLNGAYFERPPSFLAPDYWKQVVGIFRPPNPKIDRVILSFNYVQGCYFLSHPFFEPFQILEQTPDRLVITMDLIITIELIREILKMGSEVQVLEPPHLIEQIRGELRLALQQYGTDLPAENTTS